MKLSEVFPLFFNSHRLRVNDGKSCIVLTLLNGSVKLHHGRAEPCGSSEEQHLLAIWVELWSASLFPGGELSLIT